MIKELLTDPPMSLNELADTMVEEDTRAIISKITKRINGGTHGLEQRFKFTCDALEVLDTEFTV